MPEHMQYWKIVWKPWQREVKTLADVPEGVRCVVEGYEIGQNVRLRRGKGAVDTIGRRGNSASGYRVLQILDPVPLVDMPKTLADVPELRLAVLGYQDGFYFHTGGCVYFQYGSPTIDSTVSVFVTDEVRSVTDWVAELVTVKAGDT